MILLYIFESQVIDLFIDFVFLVNESVIVIIRDFDGYLLIVIYDSIGFVFLVVLKYNFLIW